MLGLVGRRLPHHLRHQSRAHHAHHSGDEARAHRHHQRDRRDPAEQTHEERHQHVARAFAQHGGRRDHVVQRLLAAGESGEHEAEHHGNRRHVLGELAGERAPERKTLAVCVGDLHPEERLAEGRLARRSLHQAPVEQWADDRRGDDHRRAQVAEERRPGRERDEEREENYAVDEIGEKADPEAAIALPCGIRHSLPLPGESLLLIQRLEDFSDRVEDALDLRFLDDQGW